MTVLSRGVLDHPPLDSVDAHDGNDEDQSKERNLLSPNEARTDLPEMILGPWARIRIRPNSRCTAALVRLKYIEAGVLVKNLLLKEYPCCLVQRALPHRLRRKEPLIRMTPPTSVHQTIKMPGEVAWRRFQVMRAPTIVQYFVHYAWSGKGWELETPSPSLHKCFVFQIGQVLHGADD
ncbi:hypothetical protein PG994_007904 [Apiospora phragmitis]|uniref:Uncharacterized protein n=1 Tax=Apiospora phragmitis TaxID=2905665 RepID=A0ABR1URI3_9PEZI